MKHVIFIFCFLVLILSSISWSSAAVNVDIANGQIAVINQSTLKVSHVTVDIDGMPLQGTYWAVLQWDPVNCVLVPISYGAETTGLGLRIFATFGKHVGDFKNDPLLPGATAIQKADAFCNSDAAKPSTGIYKVLIVDGVDRDAVRGIDWVLQPNTTYYRADGLTVIGATTANAIFPALYADLINSVVQPPPNATGPWGYGSDVWTGIGNSADFSAGGNCVGWSSASGVGDFGYSYRRDQTAFVVSLTNCDARNSLYCVEQP